MRTALSRVFVFTFVFDLLVKGAPLFSAPSGRSFSICCQARLKKLISMAC
jgi:hypothetical protein